MNDIAKLFAERIAAGLKRKSLTTCSRYTSAVRVMGKPYPGPWNFRYHPWLKEMHDCDAELVVGQKSAQMGYTEWALNRTFFMIDVKSVDCLYVLPASTPDASDFSAARFDPALEMSEHLSKLFSDVKNVGHKRAGSVNLYVRGSKSRSGLKSIPTGFIVLDEVDEMEQDNIPLAMERAAGQVEKQVLAISTPTIPDFGINKMFRDTTQEHFWFPCPCCNRWIELIFPDCMCITAEEINDPNIENSYLQCRECKGKLEHETKYQWLAKGKWQPTFDNRHSRGFHINQLYSSTVRPSTIARSYLRAQRDPAEEQEFHNSKMGIAHIVEGAAVTDSDIDKCIGQYKRYTQLQGGSKLITMGIDVGRWLHWEIDEWSIPGGVNSTDINVLAQCKVLTHGKCREFEELDVLIHAFRVSSIVIDAHPERRKAYELACRFFGFVKLCMYVAGVNGKQIHVGDEDNEHTIKVDRTSWLDLSLGRFKIEGQIKLPMDVSQEYRSHIKNPVRIYEKDVSGNPVGRYVTANDEDHYAHARNYAEIALQFAAGLANPQDFTG